jgi:hypothetical protein
MQIRIFIVPPAAFVMQAASIHATRQAEGGLVAN